MLIRFLMTAIFSLMLSMMSISLAVTAIPNEAIVSGTVREVCITSSLVEGMSPEQVIYRLLISVETSEDVEGAINLLKDRKDQTLEFLTKEPLLLDLFGKRIKGRVRYTGDEKGGRFWINNIEILK